MFQLYRNGVFHSEHITLKSAEKTAQVFMSLEQHIYAAIYSKNAAGQDQLVFEMFRGRGQERAQYKARK